jgi:hypothetical protein
MQRIIVGGVLGLLGLVTLPLTFFGQSTPPQSRDRRLEEALSDISLLKRLVKEQDRRIADLEKTLHSLQPGAPAAAVEVRPRVVPKTSGARWQDPLAWMQIREGMSRAQVEEILGKPTSVDAVIDYQTLNYKGDTPGGGVLTGSVKLTDDRVSAVSLPTF